MRDAKKHRKKRYIESLDQKLKAAAIKGLLILPTRPFRLNGSPLKLTGRPLSAILQEIRG